MKNFIALLIYSLAIFSSTEKKENYVVISGNIKSIKNAQVDLYYKREGLMKKVAHFQIKKDGSFKKELDIPEGEYVFMLSDPYKAIPIYITKGSKISFSYDESDVKNTIKYKGDNVAINAYLFKKRQIYWDLESSPIRRELNVKADELGYKKYYVDQREKATALLMQTKNLPSWLVANEKESIYYSYMKSLISCEFFFRFYGNKDFNPSENFLKEIKEFNFNDVNHFSFSKDYRALVYDYYSEKAKNDAYRQKTNEDQECIKVFSNISNEKIKNTLLVYLARDKYFSYGKKEESFYRDIVKVITDTDSKKAVQGILSELTKKNKRIAKGAPSPKFIDYDNFLGGKTSLDDFKGKYVYIDLWATWCMPCIKEIPSLKELEKEYKDKNIEFVSISVDNKNDYEKWKKLVKQKKLGGVQLFADENLESSFTKAYGVVGIPRFIFIDAKGNIIDADAPRPSAEKEIKNLFDQYLAK